MFAPSMLTARQNAVVEDVDMKAARGLDKALFARLAAGDWIDQHQNLIVIGPTGVGKSWIACALAHKACRSIRRTAATGSSKSSKVICWGCYLCL